MGGKNKADNSQVVQQQQQEAAQEAQKEADRQARLTQGLASIKQAFGGSPVMGTKTNAYDWSTFNPQAYQQAATAAQYAANSNLATAPPGSGGVPPGYTMVQVATPAAASATTGRGATTGAPSYNVAPSYSTSVRGQTTLNAQPVAGGGGQSGMTWALKGPDGKIYNQGDQLNYDTTYDTGQTSGGFDDAFYNKYKQSVLDYYMPQVDKQYSDAKNELTYRLGRSGNIRSSAANTAVADLASQNDINQAGVRNQADTAEGDLRTQVSSERAKATSQLYATEDPEVAANQALASVRDISLSQPNLSPLSALFNVATVGGANVLKGYQGQQTLNTFNNALTNQKRSQAIVPT